MYRRLGKTTACVTQLFLLGMLLVAAPTYAQTKVEEADAHLSRASTLYQHGKYEAAIKELKAAYAKNPLPRILCNLAQAFRKNGQAQEALEHYELCLHTDPQLGAGQRAEFQDRVKELRAELHLEDGKAPPTVIVVERPAAATAPTEKPVYKRAWFWGLIGGLVAVTAIGVGVGVGVSRARSEPQPPDGALVLTF